MLYFLNYLICLVLTVPQDDFGISFELYKNSIEVYSRFKGNVSSQRARVFWLRTIQQLRNSGHLRSLVAPSEEKEIAELIDLWLEDTRQAGYSTERDSRFATDDFVGELIKKLGQEFLFDYTRYKNVDFAGSYIRKIGRVDLSFLTLDEVSGMLSLCERSRNYRSIF